MRRERRPGDTERTLERMEFVGALTLVGGAVLAIVAAAHPKEPMCRLCPPCPGEPALPWAPSL